MKHQAILLLSIFIASFAHGAQWQTVETQGEIHARHEAGLINMGNDIYLLGGRRIEPVNRLDTLTNTWHSMAPPPLELHHFQPVIYNDLIYVIGAMTGSYPKESPVANIYIFNPKLDKWYKGDLIPETRRRGGAGVSVYQGKIYISGGITQGHWTGTQQWFDAYDPSNGKWQKLADMPHGRDHFQSAVSGDFLYSAGGRITSAKTNNVFNQLVREVDVYSFSQNNWTSLNSLLPTARAGNSVIAMNAQLWVVGGESDRKGLAHNEVDIFDILQGKWLIGSPLQRGRHGSGLALINSELWTASGSGKQGGSPELNSVEKLEINE